jgi:phenylacetate-CoA ligase
MKPIQAPPRARESLMRLVSDLLRRSWSKIDATHYFDDYEASQWLAPAALRELQLAKLRRLVWHCFLDVPWYGPRIGAALAPSAIEGLADTVALPIARAEDRRDARAFVAVTKEPVGELRRTHGTRGAPHPVVVDVETVERQKAVRLRAEAWTGVRPAKILAVWGRDALRAPRALDGAELDALAIALGRLRDGAVSGPGPQLGALAERLGGGAAATATAATATVTTATAATATATARATATVARARAVIARGEDPDGGGARLAERLGARLHRFYGAAEVGLIAASCDRSGAALHVQADHLIVEIVDAAGARLPDGEPGRVVVTDLHNRAAPYLRYDLGDRARLLAHRCACGRALPLVELVGRA